jgi:hypothetical protein
MVGTATTQLRAPTSGPFEAILFFTDRSIANSTSVNVFTGNNLSFWEGTIYLPSVKMEFTGNATIAAYTILVAWQIKTNGSADIQNNYSGLENGSPIKTSSAMVVE